MVHQGRFFRPGEAAEAIGIKPSTLRVYVQRFGELLGDDANAAERDGGRLYTERDIDTLRRAKELIARGLTYERALAELRGGAGRRGRPGAERPMASAEPNPVVMGLQALEQAVEAWRQLAEARADEIAELRAELRRLQDMLITGGTHLTPLPRARESR
jgi:DNA-binding transcriptional MerR regulator